MSAPAVVTGRLPPLSHAVTRPVDSSAEREAPEEEHSGDESVRDDGNEDNEDNEVEEEDDENVEENRCASSVDG